MGKAFKCDRCNKYFSGIPTRAEIPDLNRCWNNFEVELCDDCTRSFTNWYRNPSKETPND